MAEELVCGGNWPWNSSRNFFSSSPCSLATNDVIGAFGWPNNDVIVMDMKSPRSSDDSATSDGPVASIKPPTNVLDMMGVTTDWINQDLISENYSNFQMNSNVNYEPQSKPENTFNSSLINTPCFSDLSTSTTHSTGFPLNSASYNYTSSLLQTLFDTDSQPQQQPLLDYSSNSNGFLPKPSPMLNPQPNAPLWNVASPDLSNGPSTFTQSHHFLPSTLNNKRPNHPSFGAKHQHEEGKAVGKKGSNEAFKRPRIETPSPLPTFKVRKEKLGDRITALQQLVSPFGKTDTASVLHEAIEYIKFLHDQVNALSTPYLKYGSPPVQRQQGGDKTKDGEGLQIKDLNSRGLCLVPISSTFPVAAETPSDFWTPTFGANLK